MDIIQLSEIKRCPLCGKPTQERHATTGEYVHSQCAEGYNQYWDEREAEMQYRWQADIQPVPNTPHNPFTGEEWTPPTDEDLAWEDEYARKIEAELGLNRGPRLTLLR
jgi:hypothetical protein